MKIKDLELPEAVTNLLQKPDVRRGFEESAAVANICRALANTRQLVGISQKQLAEKSGVDQAEISRIEAGTQSRGPTLLTLVRLTRAMGIQMQLDVVPNLQAGIASRRIMSPQLRAKLSKVAVLASKG